MGKTRENERNRLRLVFFKKYVFKKIMKQQSKFTFNGIHKSYDIGDSYTFEQIEVRLDKPIYLELPYWNYQNYFCLRHIMINHNHILDAKIFNYAIWIQIASF